MCSVFGDCGVLEGIKVPEKEMIYKCASELIAEATTNGCDTPKASLNYIAGVNDLAMLLAERLEREG